MKKIKLAGKRDHSQQTLASSFREVRATALHLSSSLIESMLCHVTERFSKGLFLFHLVQVGCNDHHPLFRPAKKPGAS
jgi:hypothetical protein